MDEAIIPEDDSIFEALVDFDNSIRSDILQDDSFSSIPGVSRLVPVASSTPAKAAQKTTVSGQSRADRLQCTLCTNTYANDCTLQVHMRMHAMKRASSRLPSKEELTENAPVLFVETLKEMKEECISITDDAKKLLQLIDDLLLKLQTSTRTTLLEFFCEHFSCIVRSRNVLLPSAIRSSLYSETNKLFAKVTYRRTLKDLFLELVMCEEGVMNVFIGSFMLKFYDKLLSFVFRSIHGQSRDEDRRFRSADVLESTEFQQTLYHIIGSVIHGCFVRGRMYKTSGNWAAYCEVLRAKYIRQPEQGNQCNDSVSAFSSGKDRGGYVHCNQETFDFFFKLLDLLMSLEGGDGSLPLDVVDKEVCNDDILLFMWDDLIGSELSEEQSMFLLLMICHISVKVIVKGIIKRRLNDELKSAYCSVALRPKLARK